MSTLQAELQRLAARPNMASQGCANVWAGTSGLGIVGALNVKAGNAAGSYRDLAGVLNQLAGTTGLGEVEAARRIVTAAPAQVTPAPTATATAGPGASISFVPVAGATSYIATSSPGGVTGTSTGSPIQVNGLAPLTAYTFTVAGVNSSGTGPASAPSNQIVTGAS